MFGVPGGQGKCRSSGLDANWQELCDCLRVTLNLAKWQRCRQAVQRTGFVMRGLMLMIGGRRKVRALAEGGGGRPVENSREG